VVAAAIVKDPTLAPKKTKGKRKLAGFSLKI
jgi:hypothetical protein